jgi:hypothetical protein
MEESTSYVSHAVATVDWTTWVTILLAAATLIVTAVAVIFTIASVLTGLLAVYGYGDLKKSLIAQVQDQVETAVAATVASLPTAEFIIDKIQREAFTILTAAPAGENLHRESRGNDDIMNETAQEAAAITDSYPGQEEQNVGDSARSADPASPGSGVPE